jgi:hypothetical protein
MPRRNIIFGFKGPKILGVIIVNQIKFWRKVRGLKFKSVYTLYFKYRIIQILLNLINHNVKTSNEN